MSMLKIDEFHKMVDLIWNDNNRTVTYKQVRILDISVGAA